ncbi:hypothetical protein ABMA28_000459 [Loxostege sticticalis]|uniref:Uncharacterized protein n=1 Tax=Loxostege sticticalis TaxID=481309 RepID=A0ABD0TSC0_LOXSC
MTTLKSNLLQVMLSGLIRLTTQSIAGVTYMDHFDFEERYRNVYECDPFHWYPLHLPPHCAKMYQELISKGITSLTNSPVRVMTERESNLYSLNHNVYASHPFYQNIANSEEGDEQNPSDPYMKMFQMLRGDVKKDPSAPTITNMPGFGAVALYKQPISRKSGQHIKKIAGLYRDAYKQYNKQYGNGFVYQDSTASYFDLDEGKNETNEKIHFTINEKDVEVEEMIKNYLKQNKNQLKNLMVLKSKK